jgi:ATP-dependent helicase/DNAse subunit B
MPLNLITGPAGSGKTGEMLERFASELEREPVLVVPTYSDVERFEDELLARRPVALGGRVVTFARLVELAAAAAGHVPAPPLGSAQRHALLRAVATQTELSALATSARRPGFVDALDALLADVQGASIDPAALGRRLGTGRARSPDHLRDAARLCAAYAERRDGLGRSDAGSVLAATTRALAREPAAWGGRPVLFHGFDDLTPAQLGLVAALAAAAEVTVSVVHEPGRACLAARHRLVEALERLGPVERVELDPQAATGLLTHLERCFLVDDPPRWPPDGSLRLLDSAGPRNEVEQAGAAIARLLRDGAAPDDVAVILRSPGHAAGLVEEVFRAYGIPTAVHAWRRFDETATGRAVIALVRAALVSRSAADLIAFLRCPGRAGPGAVDRLERDVRRRRIESADEAVERWRADGGRALWEVDELRAAASRGAPQVLDRLVGVVRSIAQFPHRRAAALLEGPDGAEQRAADAAAEALAEVAELAVTDAGLAPDPEGLIELLGAIEAPRSAATARGCVEVMSPYRARARQFPYVFVLSLQDGEFPRRGREDPFLSDGERSAAGLVERADARDEERYLFYVAVTRATKRLHLSFRTSDEEGRAAARSFLVDDVLDLLEPGAEAELTERKGLSDTVFAPVAAPTERELARALAADRLAPLVAAATNGNGDGRATVLADRLEGARSRADRLPGPFEVPFVVRQFAGREQIGASSLESYAECPFRYLVNHELRPRELAPDPEPLTRGGLVHRVLEQLYEERRARGEPVRATPATLDGLIERARELLREAAEGTSLAPRRPATRALYRRMESDLVRLLRYDAEHGADAEVYAVEAAFGDEGEPRSALPLSGFKLHGKIDRIDVAPSGEAIVRDYKTGSKVTRREKLAEEGKLQLPLYLLAARRLWGLDVAGAVYHPLGDQRAHRPRGLLRGPVEALPFGEPFVKSDITADEVEFERHLSEAEAEATRIARDIHAGHLARTPIGGSCPHYCDYHPICRRERGEKNPEDAERIEREQADE